MTTPSRMDQHVNLPSRSRGVPIAMPDRNSVCQRCEPSEHKEPHLGGLAAFTKSQITTTEEAPRGAPTTDPHATESQGAV